MALVGTQTLMHPDTHEEGGLGFTNKQLLDQQRAAVLDIFKEVRLKSHVPRVPSHMHIRCTLLISPATCSTAA